MIYEPRQQGCLCDACPLNEKRPVPPEIRPGAKLLVVGQASGPVETARGYPLSGPSGLLFEKALAACGHTREEVSVSNALLCEPPMSFSKSQWSQALACCEPRLQREVQEHPAVLAFGAVAFKALQKLKGEVVDLSPDADPDEDGNAFGEAGLMRLRGFPLDLAGRPFLATWNPAHVLRTRRWVDTFLWDVGKAFRHAAGALDWVDPEMHFDPSTDECDSVFARLEASGKRPIVDVETTYEKAYVAKLRCVGVGTSTLTIVLPWRSVETPARKFKMTPEQCRERYNNFFRRVGRAAGQNILSFDRTILDRYGLILPADTLDTLAADHIRDPELPHDLDYLASRFTDAPKHKPGGGDHWTSDAELHNYNARDLAATFAVAPKAFAGLNRKVYDADTRFMEIARQMHLIGFHLDVNERERHRVRLTQAMVEARFRAREILGKDVNLSSHEAVRHYLFTERGLPWPSIVTASELPSTSKDAIYELLTRALPDDVGRWIEQGLLEFRWAQKKLTAFVETSIPDELGRVHADWNAVAQIVGRPSAKKPALNTMPHLKDDTDSVRSMFDAEPGHVLVSADMSQLHLRLIAVMADIPVWKDVFNDPRKDLHKINASFFFNKSISDIAEFERTFAKTLIYQFGYKGMPTTACANMRKVRDPKTGERPYKLFSLNEAEKMRDRLLRRIPELPAWWDKELRTAKRQRMLKSYLLGRPHYFRDIDLSDVKPEEQSAIINYPVLSTEADLMGGGGAAGKFVEAFPWYLYGPNTGLIHHGYDSLTVETPADKVASTAKMLRESLETTIESVPFPAEVKQGLNWAKLDKLRGES